MAQPESASPTNIPASPTALPVEGFRGTPEEIERQWYEQVYRGLVGILLTLLPKFFPARRHLIPSPAGVGLAWTFHWHYGLLFFIGGVLGWWVERKHPQWSAEFTFPVASGWIAGESLMGAGLVMWENGPELACKLLGR